MPAGMRPLSTDDPENDPELEAALARFAASQPAPAPRADVTSWSATPEQAEAEAARFRAEKGMPYSGANVTKWTATPEQAEAEAARFRAEHDMDSRPSGGGVPRPMGAPAAALSSMAAGASMPPRPEEVKPTPEGEALFADLQAAGKASAPPPESFLDRLSRGAAETFTHPGLLQAMKGQAVTSPTPLQSLSDAVDDIRNPLPDVSMSLPGNAPPVAVPEVGTKRPPRIQVGHAAPVKVVNALNLQSHAPGMAEGALPADHPAVVKGLEAARSNVKVAPGTAESDLDAALKQSADRRLLAGLTRAGAAAIGRGQGAAYDALDEQADRPLAELQLRRADEAAGKAKAAQAAEQDPTSPQSQMARSILSRMVPDLDKDPGFASLTAARAKDIFPGVKELYEAASRKELEGMKIKGEIDKAKAKHAGGGGPKALTPTQELQREKFDQSLREKATKDSEGASELSDTLDRLEGALKSGDLPGVGRVVGPLASHGFGSDAGIRMRSDLQRLADVILRARSGAAVTPSEAERLAIESGTSSGATEQQVRIATQTAIGIMRRAERNLRAKYPGATWEQLAEEGGWTPGSKSAAPSAGPAQVKSVADYNALPPGAEYIDPNGKHKRKGG